MAELDRLNAVRELVLEDPQLQAALRGVTGTAEFTRVLLRLAAENGCDLTEEDIAEGMRAGKRAWIERWI